MITDLNEILVEWSYRTSDGKPDVKNSAKLIILESVLNDFGWSREARAELLNTLMEVDIVRKKQPDGSMGSSYTVQKHNPEKGQVLVTKNASDDAVAKVTKGKVDKEKDDKEKEEKPKDKLVNQDHEITDKQLNMTKSEAKAQAKSKEKKDVGAGTPESRAGEAMVHKGLRLLKEGKSLEEIQSTFTELVNEKDHILNSKEGKKWVGSCISSLKKIDEEIGIKNIEDVSWDTPQGREAIGVDVDLKTSSDMFVRTKDGRNIGISLKKDGNVFLNNGGWSKQSKKLIDSLRGTMPDEDLERLDSAMNLKEYKKDLSNRLSDAADRIGVEEIKDAFDKLQNETETPSVFRGATQEEYYRILSNPKELVDKLKKGKLSGNEVKAYTKLLQVYHKDEYDEIRKIDNNLTKRAFDAINSSDGAKKGMKKHIVKSMHISETLGLNEEVKQGGVDEFVTTYGIKPDGAILNEKTLITLLGSKFEKTLNETIQEVRDGNASKEDLNEVIEDAIEIDYESGMILFKHENNKKYPLFYMAGRTRGIGASPVMELAQTPLMAHALKEGTFNTDDWSEKGLGRFKDDIQDIYK
mgnify:CR=1 FL=1|tara:strand:+ start:23 stop:1765 length:1743 start_codon:yes stop_codon:yes gene_type:complete